jgi:hypothetical protein
LGLKHGAPLERIPSLPVLASHSCLRFIASMAFGDANVQAFKTREPFDHHSDDMLKRWSRDHQAHPESRQGLP